MLPFRMNPRARRNPNYFYLIRKSEPEKGRVNLVKLDEELCRVVGDPVDPTMWCRGWYDSIGFYLSLGYSFAKIRQKFDTPFPTHEDATEDEFELIYEPQRPILDYLEANFEAGAGYSPS